MNEYPQAVVEVVNKGQVFLVEQVSPYHYHIKVNNKIKHLKLSANEAMKILGEQIGKNKPKTISLKNHSNKEISIGTHYLQVNDMGDELVSVELFNYPCLELDKLEQWKKDKTFNQKAKIFKEFMNKHDKIEESLNFKDYTVEISSVKCAFNDKSIVKKGSDWVETRAILDNWLKALQLDDDFPIHLEANINFKDPSCKISAQDLETIANKLHQMQSEIEKEIEQFLNN